MKTTAHLTATDPEKTTGVEATTVTEAATGGTSHPPPTGRAARPIQCTPATSTAGGAAPLPAAAAGAATTSSVVRRLPRTPEDLCGLGSSTGWPYPPKDIVICYSLLCAIFLCVLMPSHYFFPSFSCCDTIQGVTVKIKILFWLSVTYKMFDALIVNMRCLVIVFFCFTDKQNSL